MPDNPHMSPHMYMCGHFTGRALTPVKHGVDRCVQLVAPRLVDVAGIDLEVF